MPKASKVGKFRAKAAEYGVAAAADETNKDGDQQSMSRGQRKRQAKRDQYLKRDNMVMSSLRLQKQQEQAKRIDGLDALRHSLPMAAPVPQDESSSSPASPEKNLPPGTNRAKRTLASKEVTHMGLVLQHPAFKANPFATIQQHLKNTLATQAKEQEITSEQRRTKEAQELVKKKEVKKERKIDLQLRRKPRGQHHSRPGSNQRTTRR